MARARRLTIATSGRPRGRWPRLGERGRGAGLDARPPGLSLVGEAVGGTGGGTRDRERDGREEAREGDDSAMCKCGTVTNYTCANVGSGRVRIGSRSGHGSHRTARARPVPITGSGRVGPCTLRERVGSGFFRVGSGFLAFGFFGLGRVLGKKSRPVPGPLIVAGQKIQPVPIHHVARVGSGRVFFGRVGSGCSGRVTHAQV